MDIEHEHICRWYVCNCSSTFIGRYILLRLTSDLSVQSYLFLTLIQKYMQNLSRQNHCYFLYLIDFQMDIVSIQVATYINYPLLDLQIWLLEQYTHLILSLGKHIGSNIFFKLKVRYKQNTYIYSQVFCSQTTTTYKYDVGILRILLYCIASDNPSEYYVLHTIHICIRKLDTDENLFTDHLSVQET